MLLEYVSQFPRRMYQLLSYYHLHHQSDAIFTYNVMINGPGPGCLWQVFKINYKNFL